jgi:uncharacterized protein with HEPN domain
LPSDKPLRRINDILYNITLIETSVGTRDEASWQADFDLQDAVLFRLLRMSEAASKLGELAEAIAPEQPRPRIRAFGNVSRHQYDDLSMVRIWRIIKNDLPSLRSACEKAVAELVRGDGG